MKKKIIFEIETTESDERIKHYLKKWIVDNFQKTESKIIVEDLQ